MTIVSVWWIFSMTCLKHTSALLLMHYSLVSPPSDSVKVIKECKY